MAEHTVHDVVNGTQSMGAQPVDVSDLKQTSGANVEGGSNEEVKTISEDAVDSAVDTTVSGGARATDTPRWRERANSFKKPKAFQPVSVTKTFLGKSISSDPQRSAEKSLPSDQSSSIIRPGSQPSVQKKTLNLKTGSSSRIATARATTPASGPDAAKVWNRNQPVAPPPPKQFTDEELKQQYGIHMATRLEAGESGTQSKWADIDDDDDNWVPDGVMEWTDGTKTSLAPTKPSPQPSPKPEPAEPREPSPANEPPKPQVAAPSTGKTILRPGVRSSTVALGKPGLILRGQPESTATATSSTPPVASARSPWATLPPVDKVSPIAFNPPAPTPPPSHRIRRPSQDYDVPSPQQPTRELAADDFNRWNDVDRQSKELFNSQSGRYEPVKGGGRRSSMRNEGHRRPSVLQRPSQINGSYPDSAGHQQIFRGDVRLDMTNHKQQADESAIDSSQAETDSHELSHTPDSPIVETRSTGPNSHQPPEHPTRTAEEERAEQQRLMKERIELNRRRIQAEREREEEAVKERIRLKMKALDAEKEKKEAEKKQEERKRLEDAKANQPSPPSVGINGEPAQALSSKSASEPLLASQVQLTPPKSPATGQGLPSQTSAADDLLVPARDGLKSHPSGNSSPRTFEQDARSWTQLANRSSANSGWAGSGIPGPTAAGGNVWGPPSNDKTLGNGVFESGSSALQRSPNRSIQRPGPPPGPIGPLSVPPRGTGDGSHFQTAPPGIGPVKGHNSTVPSEQTALRYAPTGKPPSSGRPKTDLSAVTRAWGHVQAAIAQGEVDRKARQAAREAELAADPNAPEPVSTFNVTFRKTEPMVTGNELQHATPEENKGLLRESEPAFGSGPPGSLAAQPPIQAPIGSMPHSRFFGPNAPNMPQRVQWSVPGHSRSPSPPPPETSGHPVFEAGRGPRPRVSFPPGKPTVRLPPPIAHMPNGFNSDRASGSNSVIMPQRTTSGVYGGSKPIVQQAAWQDRFNDLLGRQPAPIPVPKFAPPVAAPLKLHHQPSVAISSASRVPLDAGPVRATTVSLPREKTKVSFALPDGSVESKPSEEEMMEDRGFGSLPTVRLPQIESSTDFAASPRGGGKAANAEKNFAFGSTSDFKEADALLDGQHGPHISIVVRLHGMQEVTKLMPRKGDGRRKPRGGDKRRVSGQSNAHGPETNVNSHQNSHEKENGDGSPSWGRSSRGPSRKKRDKRAEGHLDTSISGEKTAEFEKSKRGGSGQWNHNPRRITSRAASAFMLERFVGDV